MTTYTPTAWINNQPPPLSAANLNKLTGELMRQAALYGITHTLPTWTDGAAPALTDPTPLNEIERVCDAVATTLGLSYAPTEWQGGWSPARNAANFNKLEEQARANAAAEGGLVALGFPKLFSIYGLSADARWDMVVGYGSWTSSIEAAKQSNPDLIALMNGLRGYGELYEFPNWTYGPGFDISPYFAGATDSVTDGEAGDAGTMRATDPYWDFLYSTDGQLVGHWSPYTVPSSGIGKVLNLSNWAYSTGLSQPTWELLARFVLWKLKRNSLYRSGVWDGFWGDNLICPGHGGYAHPDIDTSLSPRRYLDTNRDGQVDTSAQKFSNYNDGIDKAARWLGERLPGMTTGGNGPWMMDTHVSPTWASYATDHDGWHKYVNACLIEVGADYLWDDASAQKIIDVCDSVDSSVDSATGASRLGWNQYPDYFGRDRHVVFMNMFRDSTSAYSAMPAGYNTPSVYKGAPWYQKARQGLALSLCAAAYYEPRWSATHDCRLFYDDEMRGDQASPQRGWMGQPTARPGRPQAGIFLREYEHGLAICNIAGNAQTVTLPDGSWRRIAGDGTNAFNTGATCGATVSVAARDGVLLVRQ